MRSRRNAGLTADAELEMLQTDIMRFMAIIALCLLAIFAMVQSLAELPSPPLSSPEPLPVSQVKPTRPVPAAVPVTVPAPQPRPAEPVKQAPTAPPPEPVTKPAEEPVEEGFFLKFANDAAFMSLLRQKKIRVQVQRPDQGWRWENGSFQSGKVAGDFYQLQPATVPLLLRQQFTPLAPAAGSQWLVSLPAQTRSDLASIMAQFKGGTLIIDAQGKLSRQ